MAKGKGKAKAASPNVPKAASKAAGKANSKKNNTKVHVLFLQAKPYEAEAMLKVVKSAERYTTKGRFPSEVTPHESGKYKSASFRFKFTPLKTTRKAWLGQITVVSLDMQGPIQAATSTSQVLNDHSDVTHIGMMGVCGGRKLLEKVVAMDAIDGQAGRVVLSDKETLPPVAAAGYQPPQENPAMRYRHKAKKPKKNEYFKAKATCPTGDNMLDEEMKEHVGTLTTYSAVREDCGHILENSYDDDDNVKGLDMESFAFMKAVHDSDSKQRSRPKVLPVVKSVSDVSPCDLEAADNSSDAQKERVAHNRQVAEKFGIKGDVLSAEYHKKLRTAIRREAASTSAEILWKLTQKHVFHEVRRS
eukprot:m.56238 g.56238  ORF g.56238 m.56238 type:complete len:360 (-) comp9294_c0_seq4:3823-4902(-)